MQTQTMTAKTTTAQTIMRSKMPKTSLRASECISDALDSHGLRRITRLNQCVDKLVTENYITGKMAEDIQSLLWQAIYEAKKIYSGNEGHVTSQDIE